MLLCLCTLQSQLATAFDAVGTNVDRAIAVLKVSTCTYIGLLNEQDVHYTMFTTLQQKRRVQPHFALK
jgi:hypothetical protein